MLNLYTIDSVFIEYLHSYDKEVYFNEKNENYHTKPYIGLIINNKDFNYFVPLTSAKLKHLELKNTGKDYMLIFENDLLANMNPNDIYSIQTTDVENIKVKKILSLIEFKKAIPVPDGYYDPIIIIKGHKDEDLLRKEFLFCKRKNHYEKNTFNHSRTKDDR